jgi:hypothetical protein
MLLEEPAPRMSADKWVRGPKRTDESAREHVRFETCHSQSYEFDRNKMGILRIMH